LGFGISRQARSFLVPAWLACVSLWLKIGGGFWWSNSFDNKSIIGYDLASFEYVMKSCKGSSNPEENDE
jgi:hypothetical protein